MAHQAIELPRTADVVIIGSGVVGCSIANHLARRGVRDVLERDAVRAGTTSKAAGGIRGQVPTETEGAPTSRDAGPDAE
jgi:sarcosine oxidase subunit beta